MELTSLLRLVKSSLSLLWRPRQAFRDARACLPQMAQPLLPPSEQRVRKGWML